MTLPSRSRIARSEFEAARYRAVDATLRLVAETRRAYYRAVASRQIAAFLERARSSAEAAATLSRRLGETGAASKLDQARAAAFYAEISGQLAQARLTADLERETLTRSMGVWGAEIDYKLPAQLPDTPAKIARSQDIEAQAIRRRVDLIAARLELDSLARQYGLANATRFVSTLELAGIAKYERKVENGEKERSSQGFRAGARDPDLRLRRRCHEACRRDLHAGGEPPAERAVNVRSEARAAYVRYRGKHDLDRHYRRVLPLRKTIEEQALLQYSGMLVDVFDLLTTSRESVPSNVEAINARRDFFIAGVDLQTAIIGGGTGGGGEEGVSGSGEGGPTAADTEGATIMTVSRRNFLGASGAAVALVGAGAVRAVPGGLLPEAPTMTEATMQPPFPEDGPDYQPVVTLNGWTLPWRMNGDWKEFHLVAEPVVRELAPGMKAHLWGYNGQSPGPTIEAVEGDKVRIFVTNKLPEHTTVHWHGQLLPNGMDGVGGLTQPHIPPGKTFVYEFMLRKSGTFMYHPHSDEMVQMAMGMMGFFVVHPRDPAVRRVDRDFVFLLNAFDIEAGALRAEGQHDARLQSLVLEQPRVSRASTRSWSRKGDKVRIRFGNLTMTNHPDPHARLRFQGHRHRWRLGAGRRALARGDGRRRRRADARLRVRRRRRGRLGDPLPQVASHHERHGPRRAELHRREHEGASRSDQEARPRLHADGRRAAWARWARWRCRCPTTRCR